jgi:class 3 adenylate cyclase
VVEDGDLFGGHINYAARIAGQADGGEIIVSELLRQLVEPSGEFQFEVREPVTLRGIEGEHLLSNVEWTLPRGLPDSSSSASDQSAPK